MQDSILVGWGCAVRVYTPSGFASGDSEVSTPVCCVATTPWWPVARGCSAVHGWGALPWCYGWDRRRAATLTPPQHTHTRSHAEHAELAAQVHHAVHTRAPMHRRGVWAWRRVATQQLHSTLTRLAHPAHADAARSQYHHSLRSALRYQEVRAQQIDDALQYRSLYVFPNGHPVRTFAVDLIKYKYAPPHECMRPFSRLHMPRSPPRA